MRECDIREGDVVLVKDKGNALVLWKGFNNQPLIVYIDEMEKHQYRPIWSVYESFVDVVDHIDICKGFNYIFASQRV